MQGDAPVCKGLPVKGQIGSLHLEAHRNTQEIGSAGTYGSARKV